MIVVKSRPARLADVVADAPRRCPACRRRVGRNFAAIYSGDPTIPETVQLIGWRCTRCGATYRIVDGVRPC
jgi:uncharacterized protein YbaR (Trm112 family)